MAAVVFVPADFKAAPASNYYVYAHYKLTDFSVFYVGKGCRDRAFQKKGRNEHWKRTVEKHGYFVGIIKSSMTEDEAFALERDLISFYGMGNLTNMTMGGDGISGMSHSPVTIEKMRNTAKGRIIHPDIIRKGANAVSRSVRCSNGMEFSSSMAAAQWLRDNGHPKAAQGTVSNCCHGRLVSAYGLCWTFSEHGDAAMMDAIEKRKSTFSSKPVAVGCSNGMEFPSLTEAVSWLRENGRPKAAQCFISKCYQGRCETAYGFKWWRIPCEDSIAGDGRG